LFPVCSFYEESQWIRLSLVDLVLLGGGRWRWMILDPNKSRNKKSDHEVGDFYRGIMTYMINVLISLTFMILFTVYGRSDHSCSIVSAFCIYFSQLGLLFDNVINALGKYIGEGSNLRLLSKGRFLFHVVGIPLLAIPLTEVAVAHDVFGDTTQSVMTCLVSSWAVFELFHWLNYDSNELKLVDLRDSKDHKGSYLAGTLAYTSGKFLELVLPCIMLIFYELAIGCSILIYGTDSTTSRVGFLLAVSATATLISCAVPGRPDIQLYGENFHGGMIWVALA
jgi:hypothetical protein